MEKSVRSSVTRLLWIALFVVAALALVAGGYGYYRSETERIRTEKYQEIAAIAKLKAGQIQEWRQERLGDVRRASKAPLFGQRLREWLLETNNTALLGNLQDRLVLEQKEEGYADVLLLDTDYRVLLSAEPQPQSIGPETKKAIEQAVAGRTAMLSDLYRCPQGIVRVDAVAPILDAEAKPIAVLVMRSNAKSLLYPLIQSWPTSSRTAETLLVRRDGEEVIFLNELRHRPDSALSLREPLARADLPAAQAVLGKQGIFQGKDYRRVEVLAALRHIAGSPWFMVAKVDASEILMEARYRGGIVALFATLFIVLAASITAYGYRYRQARLYRDLYGSERAQREAQEEYRTTLYSIGDAVITADTGGMVKQMNQVAERLTGWREAEARGKFLDKVFHIVNEESRDVAEDPVQRVLREGTVVGLANHTLLISRDGREHPIADSGAPIRDEKGIITGVVLVFSDQAQEREAQKVLQESERRYRDLWEKTPVMMISLDSKARINFVSDLFCEEVGYDRDEILGKTPFEFQTKESAHYAQSVVFPTFLKTGLVKDAPLQLVRKNGEVMDVLLNVTAERDAEGNIVRSRSVYVDVTDRNRAEQAIRKSEAKYADLYENAPDMYVSVDPSTGLIVRCNETLSRVTGFSKEEIIGRPIFEMYHPDSIEDAKKAFQVFLTTGEVRNAELQLRRKDESKIDVALNASAVCDESGKILYSRSSWRDITDRKRAETVLLESEERFSKSFKNNPAWLTIVHMGTYKVLEVNDAWTSIFGYTREEAIGSTTVELGIHDEETYRKIMEETKAKGSVRNVEVTTRTRTGENLVLLVSRELIEIRGEPYLLAMGLDITDRKKAEEGLRKSEERYRLLVDMAPDAIVVSEDGRIIYVNRAAMQLLAGTDPGQIVGTYAIEWVHPDDRDHVAHRIQVLLASETLVPRSVWCLLRRDGAVRDVEAVSGSLRSGESTIIHTIFRDITDRKRAEQALQESEERFRILSDGAFEGVVISKDGLILDFNEVFCKMSGYTLEELVGRDIQDIVAPEFKHIAMEHVLSGSEEAYESAFVSKDGHLVPVQAKGKTIPYEGGTARIASVRDISAARRAEEVQRRLATAIEQAAEAVLITDSEGIIHYINPAVERITGFRSEELLGKTPRVFKSGEHDTAFYRQLWDTIKAGNIWSGKFINRSKDGRLYYEDATISPVKDASGRIVNFVAVKRDVTEHLQLSNQLFQAQKMEAVGTLAGGVAHDFNNLLQVVLGYSELILGDEGLPQRYKADLQKINESARRGADLVHGLLTFSRKTEVKRIPLNLNRRINEVRKMLDRTVPKMIKIQLFLAEDVAAINADGTQMDQVLLNLAVNARDAMPEGGKLVFETANVVLDEEYATSHLNTPPGHYVLLTVADTGAGMDPETLEHIFEPFYTTKETGKGTGLGLAMVYGVVRQHGGHIRCYSEPGHGTTFKIYFPALVSDEEAQETSVRAIPLGGSETILLVDDEQMIRDLCSRILTKSGYNVIAASNGKEALELYREQREKISLVILDLIMPEMGGKQCLERLLTLDPAVKVVIASGYSGKDSAKEALTSGAKGLVNKPYDMRQLLGVVRAVLDDKMEPEEGLS